MQLLLGVFLGTIIGAVLYATATFFINSDKEDPFL